MVNYLIEHQNEKALIVLTDKKFKIEKVENNIMRKVNKDTNETTKILSRMNFNEIFTIQEFERAMDMIIISKYNGKHKLVLVDSFFNLFSEYNEMIKGKNLMNMLLKQLSSIAFADDLFILRWLTSKLLRRCTKKPVHEEHGQYNDLLCP